MSPQRIQRQRTKGWRMPEGAVYVGRPSRWGNPFSPGQLIAFRNNETGEVRSFLPETVAECVEHFRFLAEAAAQDVRAELAGKDLACWCPLDDQPCHADVLLEVANAGDRS